MITVNFNPFPLITTERLILREVEENDVNEIFFLRSDKRVMKYLDRPPAKSTEEASDFIKKLLSIVENNEGVI